MSMSISTGFYSYHVFMVNYILTLSYLWVGEKHKINLCFMEYLIERIKDLLRHLLSKCTNTNKLVQSELRARQSKKEKNGLLQVHLYLVFTECNYKSLYRQNIKGGVANEDRERRRRRNKIKMAQIIQLKIKQTQKNKNSNLIFSFIAN